MQHLYQHIVSLLFEKKEIHVIWFAGGSQIAPGNHIKDKACTP